MNENKPENEAVIHAINKNEKKEPKRILTDQERAFVELMSKMIVDITLRENNDISVTNDQAANCNTDK